MKDIGCLVSRGSYLLNIFKLYSYHDRWWFQNISCLNVLPQNWGDMTWFDWAAQALPRSSALEVSELFLKENPSRRKNGFQACWAHQGTRKWLESPPFISHEKGTTVQPYLGLVGGEQPYFPHLPRLVYWEGKFHPKVYAWRFKFKMDLNTFSLPGFALSWESYSTSPHNESLLYN